MRRFPFAALALFGTTLFASPSLDHARQAQALLGPGVWSEVIEVRNPAGGGGYPRVLNALVFELEGILWFYNDTDGTQSLSICRGRAEQDKADLGALLRTLSPGFVGWSVVADPRQSGTRARKAPPNACLIESVALLREHLASGEVLLRPRLLFYYVRTLGGLRGHTVLAYETPEGFKVLDPDFPRRPLGAYDKGIADARSLAQALRPDIASARWLSVEEFQPASPDCQIASRSSPGAASRAKA